MEQDADVWRFDTEWNAQNMGRLGRELCAGSNGSLWSVSIESDTTMTVSTVAPSGEQTQIAEFAVKVGEGYESYALQLADLADTLFVPVSVTERFGNMRITLWSIDAEGTSQEVALVGNTSDDSRFDGMAVWHDRLYFGTTDGIGTLSGLTIRLLRVGRCSVGSGGSLAASWNSTTTCISRCVPVQPPTGNSLHTV